MLRTGSLEAFQGLPQRWHCQASHDPEVLILDEPTLALTTADY